MHAIDVFKDEELSPVAAKFANNVLGACNGIAAPVGLAGLFAVFAGICVSYGFDPGTEFELMLAEAEGRKSATHGFPAMVQ